MAIDKYVLEEGISEEELVIYKARYEKWWQKTLERVRNDINLHPWYTRQLQNVAGRPWEWRFPYWCNKERERERREASERECERMETEEEFTANLSLFS